MIKVLATLTSLLALTACTSCTVVSTAIPDGGAARRAEAEARRIAQDYPAVDTIVTGIYEGPALMASYRGQMRNGVYEGLGVLTLPDSAIEQAGEFRNGTLNGLGVERDVDGKILHEGKFIDGVPIEFMPQP